MDAEEIIERCEELHCVIYPGDGNNIIVIVPNGEFPDDLSSAIREHKQEVLALLRMRYPELQARDAAQFAKVEGVCVFWCDALRDLIACIRDDSFRPEVPPGAVVYRHEELMRAFGNGVSKVDKDLLRTRHALQKLSEASRKRIRRRP